ncbi:MAG: quercetin 2,3-dioxygenase [Chloroflexota bacterium]|nr:MAG: cupin domain-containing protein [Chloroflexota bacterium]
METALRPYAIHREEGEKLSFFGSLTWMKATGEQTGGVLALIEHIVPPGAGSPWHVHHNEDESFYVIEGEILFIVGEEQQRLTAGPGTYVFGPRDIPHGFRNKSSTPARMLLEVTPAGFDQFVLALAEPAPASGFAPAGPPDMEKLMAEAAKANIEILGTLPE